MAGVVVSVVVLLLCVIDIWRSWKDNKYVVNKIVKWRRIKWISDVYGVLIAIVTLVLYLKSFQTEYSLDLALYPCFFNYLCLVVEQVFKFFTRKKRDYLNVVVPRDIEEQ